MVEFVRSQSMYVAPNANVFVHGSSIGIFSNVSNAGNIGSKPGAVIKFMGTSWTNDSLATMPDEKSYSAGTSIPTSFSGTGGLFWFNNFSQSSQHPQLISGGFSVNNNNGPAFPNLQVDNAKGILLTGSTDIEVRNTMNFMNGKFWINGNNLQVGVNDPGTITGYSASNYIVTGTESNGGFLYRGKLSNSSGQIVFPVGADANYYTPAIVAYKGTAQNFRVRPFNMMSNNLLSSTYNDSTLIQTTWNIGKSTNEIAEMDVFLDIPNSLQSNLTNKNNNQPYISHYDKANEAWDTIQVSDMIYTTFARIHNLWSSSLVGRKFVRSFEQNEFFSKSVNGIIYAPEKLGLAENAEIIFSKEDNSYNIAFTIIVDNSSLVNLGNVNVSNNLSNTLGATFPFKILSLSATGSLEINENYDGLNGGDTLLLKPSSILTVKKSDTINLLVNVKNINNIEGKYYNSSFANAQSALTGNYVKTSSANGFNTSLAYSPTPLYLHSSKFYESNVPISVTLMNNPSADNKFILMSNTSFNRLTWQLMDDNGRLIQTGEFKSVLKGMTNTAATQKLVGGVYFISLMGDGQKLQTQKWVRE